jgi:hypothetical protein
MLQCWQLEGFPIQLGRFCTDASTRLYASNSSSVICIALYYGSTGQIQVFVVWSAIVGNRNLVNQLIQKEPSFNAGESQGRR